MKIKRIISFLLAFSMILSIVPSAVFAESVQNERLEILKNPFHDVNESDWFYDSVQYARINGFFDGTSDTTFDPYGAMTRGMFVTVLGRMAGVDVENYRGQFAFDDVSRKAYYAPYVAWAVKHGIASGTGDGKFSPDLELTHQQMAAFLERYFEIFNVECDTGTNITTVPADMENVADWAQDAVIKLWKQGLMDSDGTNFNPDDKVTRAQTAAIAVRADEAVSVWCKEPDVPFPRVKLDPATGLPFEFSGFPDDEQDAEAESDAAESDDTVSTESDEQSDHQSSSEPTYYTIIYSDGVYSEELFEDQRYSVKSGKTTPEFEGTPEREGYTFKGWSPKVTDKVTESVTYKAQWKKNPVKYSVTYTDGVFGEDIFANQTTSVEKGSDTPDFEGTLSRDGYTFAGWNPEVADTVTDNITYTAKWEAAAHINLAYSITYTDGVIGEEVFADQTTSVGEGSNTPDFDGTPSRKGYIFMGWNPRVAATVTGSITYTAMWELAPVKNYSVKFFDGINLLDTVTVAEEETIESLPGIEKTSKANGIFEGWYADPVFTVPFYAETPITKDTNVYAKYTELAVSELTLTSFAQMDLTENACFDVIGRGDISAITLTPMDGSDPIELTIIPVRGGYTITAADGFNPGSSYELTIPKGMNFVGSNGETLPETIRTASFSIEKEEVVKIEMSDITRFVQHNNPSVLRAGSTVVIDGANAGDLICFYHTTNPEDRDYTTSAYTNDPETWFKAASVNGNTVTLAELDDTDTEKMYNVPDNFPIIGDPGAVTGTLTLDADSDGYALDTEVYSMMLTGDNSITPDLAYAKTKISVGDFVSIYASADEVDGENSVYFGKITAYDDATGTITYVLSSAEEIENAVNLYAKPTLEGDDLISDEAKAEIEQTVLLQVQESGFAEEAAFMLAELAAQTDGFRNMDDVQVLFTDENGEPLSDEEIALLNLGASFELSDDIELTVELITSGDQLHFEDEGSVQLAVGIDAQFEVEVEDDGKICIDLSAAFVQELAIGLSVNGELVKKKILGFIPVPLGVKVGAALDLLSYTGVRVDVQAYTVAPEDESLFDQFKEVLSNPEKLADVLPDNGKFAAIKEGLTTVGDVFDKIEELEGKIEQLQDDVDTALAYAEDLNTLWDAVDAMTTDKKYTKDEWKELGETFGKTNVSGDLMDMLNLSTETELDADRYAESLEDLLTKYSEMLEKETDWVTLIEQEIGKFEYNFYGLVFFMKADFLVHTDINIAMGANLQYEVGKRYNFWMKIGLFKPEAGSSTMDLIDEQFAFQFYVMGKLGIRMGIKGTVGFAIGSSDLASVGIALEVGPYVKLYGFFIYEYERKREANTSEWISDERMAGALYLDFGLYMIVSLEAEALGLFEVSYDFIDEEFPLLEAGEKKYPYAFHYEPAEDELVLVLDDDGNSTNGITMLMPEEYRALSYCNLENGYMGAAAMDWDHYNVYLTNPAFTIDENGVISVDVPDDTRYMECDMVLTYKYGKLAFSTYDMQVTIPLVWTNLSLDEVSQYYTASVRVGNAADGYDIVWSQKVRKNEEFTLPTEEELTELIGYDEAIYSSIYYPNAGETTYIIANTSYDCTVTYTQYAVTVDGIQKADGSTTSRTFFTTYGSTFDFSSLEVTGTSIANTAYTKFAGVTTEATVIANKQEQIIDLSRPITGSVAEAVRYGITATANYADNSALVTYIFSGIDVPSVTERVCKGSLPAYNIYSVAAENGMAVKSVHPELGAVNSTTTYYVECGVIEGESYTIFLEENGGDELENIIRVGGSLIGALPVPTRDGFDFEGWYADEELTTLFSEKLMPNNDVAIYAGWTANECTVNFHVNGGNSWAGDEGSKTVTYGQHYGELPVPTRDSHSFIGWFTDTEYTVEITPDTIVDFIGTQTLYAKWHELVEIEKSFAYETFETNPVYSSGVAVELLPSEWASAPEGAPVIEQSDFTFKFMRQGSGFYEDGYPVNAGTYDVTITRPADHYYAPFSQTITGVVTIEKATRSIEQPEILVSDSGYTFVELRVADNAIPDLHSNAKITYTLDKQEGELIITGFGGSAVADTAADVVHISGLYPDTQYAVRISVTGDPNYHDAEATAYSTAGKTKEAPTDSWRNHIEPFEITEGVYKYTITTPGQLAYLAYLVNTSTEYCKDSDIEIENIMNIVIAAKCYTKFSDYTFKLGADLDMSAYTWEPIGGYDYKMEPHIFEHNGQNRELNVVFFANFSGTFLGNGHTITGMYVDGTIAPEAGENSYSYESQNNYGGLFGSVHGNVYISDVTILDSYVRSAERCASLAAFAEGTSKDERVLIENCSSEATINAMDRAAGIVGLIENGDIRNCVNRGRVQTSGSDSSTGGILATAQGADDAQIRVYDCINYAVVSGSATNVGGIVGWSEWVNVKSCVNYGSIKGSEDVGGIIGQVNDSSHLTYANVVDCVNYGSVTGSSFHIGGIAGYVIVGRIVNSANFGTVYGTEDCVGGITGEHSENKNAKTMNCVNYGKVTGTTGKYVGSIIGRNYHDKGTVKPNAYYTTVNGSLKASGTKNGSEDDYTNAYKFSSIGSTLQSNLNGWSSIEDFEGSGWTKANDGYGYIPESVYELLEKAN